MLTLIAAGVLFSIQSLFSKRYQLHCESGFRPAVWMVVFQSLWMLAIFFPSNGFRLRVTPISLLFAAGYAGCMVICSVASLFAMRLGKVAVVTLFSLAGGLLLPAGYGVALLGENLTVGKTAGAALIVLSFFSSLFGGKKDGTQRRAPLRFWLLCLTVFVANGMVGVVTKAHSIHPQAAAEKDFLLLAALFQLGAALLILLISILRQPGSHGVSVWLNGVDRDGRRTGILLQVLTVGGFAACNGVANVCSMLTAKTMDSSLQFPLLSAMVVVFTALLAWAVYHERPGPGEAVGLGLTVAGIVLTIL